MDATGAAILLVAAAAAAAAAATAPAVGPPAAARAAAAPASSPRSGARVDYATEIRPLLAARCARCHGPEKQRGGLRLDVRSSALRGGASGEPAIVPRAGARSPLVRLTSTADADERMPPEGEPLAPAEIALLRRWIDEGASWPDELAGDEAAGARHWAYVPPARPEPPAVANGAWPRTPIDRFVLRRLEREKLAPSPEAPPAILLRRVHLDLVGLPPEPRDIDAFLADPSPRAYEQVVDRLLASPHHGERWARPWLDLARYADTNGYEADHRRTIWKYRDFVIDAFNRDMPFDEFTTLQLAGDLLPRARCARRARGRPALPPACSANALHASRARCARRARGRPALPPACSANALHAPSAPHEALVATGFHRNTMLNLEAGVDPEEALYEVLVDRVNTTATVWLGTTLACAQCHNHKYDPFSQKDYFRFYAFFANAAYRATGKKGSSFERYVEPVLELPTPRQERRRRALLAEIAALERRIARRIPGLGPARARWEAGVRAASGAFTTVVPAQAASTGGATLEVLADGSVLASGENPVEDTYVIEGATDLRGVTGLRIEALPDERLPKGGPGRDVHGNFFLNGVELRVAPRDRSAPAAAVAWKQAEADDHGFDVYGQFEARNLIERPARGWGVDALGDARRLPRAVVLVAARPFGFAGGTRLELRLKQASRDGRQGLGRLRVSLTTSPAPTAIVSVKARLRGLLDVPAAARARQDEAALAKHYESIAPALAPLRRAIAARRKAIAGLGIVSTLVLGEKDAPGPPAADLRVRGAFLDKGERVTAGVPAALPPLPEGERPDRLALARWLTSPRNPLVTRVTVNRIWEQYFGRGLVETSEDFGTQGAPPTHPELLDWLATELVARRFSLKAIHRLIVTSAVYRQSSRATPELLARDPGNRLLARGPRFRLDGETIRDVSLAAAGLLARRIGGPSVFPYQPEGIWDLPYNSDRWTASAGPDRYRRGLYTFWRRTSPYPSMMTFDGTSREVCTVRRIRTNTPLQALTTLNDPAFFDAARALGRRMAREAGADPGRRAAHGFRLAAGRAPEPEEAAVLVALYERERGRFGGDPAAARAVTGGAPPGSTPAAELAALTVVANVILNLDEVLTKN